MSLLSAKLKKAIRGNRPYVLMTEIDHPDGLDYRWTGYPGDTALSLIASLQDKDIKWLPS